MTRVRSSLVLLTLAVGILIASWLQLARDAARMPTGSTYSYQSDGSAALYLWAESIGADASRLRQSRLPESVPRTLVVLQPEQTLSPAARREFERVPRDGGTLVLAGDGFALQAYLRELEVPLEPTQIMSTARDVEGHSLPIGGRFRIRATGTSLLTGPSGDTLAIRRPFFDGWLVVVATPQPFTNAALRDPAVARFVYRVVLADSPTITFDEVHHTWAPPTEPKPATVDGLLFETAPGRAVVYAVILAFVFLLLGGRRLGPPLVERSATEMRRTMYEHVQMLASLYRRAGQIDTVRAAFVRHYQRRAARSAFSTAQVDRVERSVEQVRTARSEAELIAAVAAADRAVGSP